MCTPIRILLVDDDPNFRGGIRRLLTLSPKLLVVAEAADGVEAVRLVTKLLPDAVIMDIQMPHMDGIEAAKRMADSGGGPVVIGLSNVNREREDAMREAGAAAFVTKTRAFTDLIPAIERLFSPSG